MRHWDLRDYSRLVYGGRYYFFRPQSIRARLKWWLLKLVGR